ncbi:MAG TPA: hypothetical protein VGO00_09465 [Kofleriaceae bacterium]|nr:hypothetical protein [Kofleriaceae bacterium]
MGRLDNIIKRNQRGGRPRERTIVSLGIGLIVLLILFLAVFTDLGRSPQDTTPRRQRPEPPHIPGVIYVK